MENGLIDFLSGYLALSEADIQAITALNLIRSFKKNELLLKEGELSESCYFVLKGCVRSYYLIDGDEKTTEFYTENQSVTPVSYTQRKPSEYYLVCQEDCILSVGSAATSSHLLTTIPGIETLMRKVNEELLAHQQLKIDDYINLTPEQRYLKFVQNRPDICQRVPQYHIASYLGIKPETLSRIRKRLTTPEK